MTQLFDSQLREHWSAIRPILSIRSDREYQTAVKRLNALLDEIGTNERHPLYELLDTLGTLIAEYEDRNCVLPASSPSETLRYLMEEHQLKQSDLPEIGSHGVVSEILADKRELNVRQIRALSKRFGVSPAVFL